MKSLLTLVVVFATVIAISAQGTVSGTVVDEVTGETLISAYIYVDSTDVISATDFDGHYAIDLPAGIYSIRFTYTGFDPKTVTEVDVRDGEITYLDVALSEGTEMLEEVVVVAEAIERTENAILMLQRRSDRIQDGISSQEMSRLAAGNVANAMTKVTGASVQDGKYVYIRGLGDRYSLSQLNGLPMPSIDPYRNSAQLDMIPVNLLENIITSKTFTPDQPGTFTGGNIDIKTKSFPERQTFAVKLSTQFNTQNHLQDDFLSYDSDGNTDWLGYGIKPRERSPYLSSQEFLEFADKNAELKARFGDEDAANAIQRGVDETDMRFDTIVTTSPLDYAMTLSYGNSFDVGQNSQIGIIASGTFANRYIHRPEATQATWFVFDQEEGVLQNSGDYKQTTSNMSPTVSGFAGVAYKVDNLNSVDFKILYNNSSTRSAVYSIGEDGNNIEDPSFKLGRALMWEERNMINYQIAGRHVIQKLGGLEIDWRGNIVDASLDEPNLHFFSSQWNSETGQHGIPLANVNDPFIFWRELHDDIKNAAIDFTMPFDAFGSSANKVKIGGMYSTKDRDFNEFRNIVVPSQWAQPFDGDLNEYFGEDNSGIIDFGENGNGTTRHIIGNYINEASRIENSYFGYEDVWAVYGMVSLSPWDRLRIVTGGRYEDTDIFVQSKIVEVDGVEPDSSNQGQIRSSAFLPSLNLIFSLNDNMNLRASYNHTLARPNLREIAPFASFDPLIDQFFIGNPELVNTDIKNMDLRWEWFLSPGEIVAVSAFYKTFANPISLQYLNGSNPEFQFTNVDGGEIAGLEFELRKRLDFISAGLRNFRLLTNFSIINSSTDVITQSGLEPEERPFEGQAPFIANVGLNYADPESIWDISLTYNYLGDRLSVIGREAPDLYDRAVNTLDFVLNYRFGPNNRFGLKFRATNLLNPNITRSQEYDNNQGETIEYINTEYKRGVGFGIQLEYKI